MIKEKALDLSVARMQQLSVIEDSSKSTDIFKSKDSIKEDGGALLPPLSLPGKGSGYIGHFSCCGDKCLTKST